MRHQKIFLSKFKENAFLESTYSLDFDTFLGRFEIGRYYFIDDLYK